MNYAWEDLKVILNPNMDDIHMSVAEKIRTNNEHQKKQKFYRKESKKVNFLNLTLRSPNLRFFFFPARYTLLELNLE
ncbi:MAG: hypothetical protein ACFFG0_13455 [Candidatus Thorarchaeota archaeon]